MEGRIQALASHTKAQMPQVVGEVVQRLEREIEATALGVATMAEGRTRDAVQELRLNFQANLEKNQAKSRRHEDTTQKSVVDLATKLNRSTQQLMIFVRCGKRRL